MVFVWGYLGKFIDRFSSKYANWVDPFCLCYYLGSFQMYLLHNKYETMRANLIWPALVRGCHWFQTVRPGEISQKIWQNEKHCRILVNSFVQLDIVFAGAAAVPIFGGATVLSRDDLSRKKQGHVTFILGTLKAPNKNCSRRHLVVFTFIFRRK